MILSPCSVGQADFRNSLLTKQQAARAVKCRKALNPPQVIDLSDDKSDDEALKHQTNLEGIIDLINADSPAVHAQQRNRPACAAGPSGHSLQPHPASLPSSQCFSRKAGSHHDNLTHHKYSSSSALPGSNTSMPSSHSSRKRTASSPDTIGLGPASSLGQPTSSVPSSTMSEASSTSMPPPSSSPWLKPTHALLNSSQAGSLAQPVSRPPSTRQHESRTELTPSDPGGGPIDLVHVAESTREHEGRRGFAPSDPRGGHVDLVEVPESTRQPEGRKGLAPSELRGSHIDLVKVTGNYSGALQAASRRVQHATTDPALAKALAEKAELERQLQVQALAV